MQQAAKVGDTIKGHDDCPDVTIKTGSPTVFVNGKPAARVGDIGYSHGCDNIEYLHPMHAPVITTGSSKVFINGKPAARVGDSTSCLDGIISHISSGGGSVFWA